MRFFYFFILFFLFSCKTFYVKSKFDDSFFKSDIIISFGSCNNQNINNVLFEEILNNKPELFIWAGDIIYSDTDNPDILKENYEILNDNKIYQKFNNEIEIIGTWDDHDYALNDGGIENLIKKEAQQLFLNFFDVPKNDIRRNREGIYFSKIINKGKNSIKIIVLDTRYFRTELTKDKSGKKRYIPNKYGKGTILGTAQWKWLENELLFSKANFNVIVSSIQFLSKEHGFETWGNIPHEVDRLQNLILETKAKNVIILSGDRHIAEISKTNIGNYKYPLIDFTSSGLTHAYTGFSGEKNSYRISKVIYKINFGLLKFDFKKNRVRFEIRGKNNVLLEQFTQQY